MRVWPLVRNCTAMKRRWKWMRAAAVAFFLTGLPTGAEADDVAVDVELVLAVDTSLSMDYEEQRLQLEGYIQAFRHPEVLAAIREGLHRRIAVIFVEWGGVSFQRIKVAWTLIDGPEAAYAFADRLAKDDLLSMPRTSVADAITYAATLFDGNGYKGLRRVIDVSGDGPNNQGIPVTTARDAAVARGITINGLPVLLRPGQPAGFFDLENLDVYYEDCVIGGTGAFIVPVRDRKNFAEAIRRKLILELAGRPQRVVPVQFPLQRGPRIDCLIGEKMWQNWLDNSAE
jgi:hypothetical protein